MGPSAISVWGLKLTGVLYMILGLGDRHLDNILINFGSGEVVRSDWNASVCGLKLR